MHEEVLAAHAALRSRSSLSSLSLSLPSLARKRLPMSAPRAIRGGVKRTRSESELAMGSRCSSAPRLHTPPPQPTPSHTWFQTVDAAARVQRPLARPLAAVGDAAVRVQLANGRQSRSQSRASPQPPRGSPAASPLIPFCFANGRQPRASNEPQEAAAYAFGLNDEPYDDILAVASQLRM